MTRTRSVLGLAIVVLACGGAGLLGGGLTAMQTPPPNPATKNPHLGNPQAIRSGMALYRIKCADCHGLDASGYRGPDLIGVMAGGASDERLFQTIRNGVPGTDMPAAREFDTPDDDLLMMIAYLRKIGTVAPTDRPIGNVENGARLFAAQCASCHRVAGRGGAIGPDLTRIGASRSRAALMREIRTPSEWITPAFETVTVTAADVVVLPAASRARAVSVWLLLLAVVVFHETE